uniref:ATP-dependent (S)-NAD(P)H-hydrate dehydratase n=1 Tax=Rhabditophanes sp. KR3021 TaxID=114890 RepID=A0AC35U1M0_9BILA
MSITKHLPRVKQLLPVLTACYKKGDLGRIAVIGGSEEYTGAPYFSAATLLKLGCDLAYVICTKEAAPVIKSYSPELIVYPGLESKYFDMVVNRLDSIVIGPGLGRDEKIVSFLQYVFETIKGKDNIASVVIDADGIYFCQKYPDLIRNNNKVILTPNCNEFERLYESLYPGKQLAKQDLKVAVSDVAKSLGITIMRKGVIDIVSDGHQTLTGEIGGCPRRCGGQGDLLSGSVAAFTFWAKINQTLHQDYSKQPFILDGAVAASDLIRHTAQVTFNDFGRSMTASDILKKIGDVIHGVDKSQ